METTILEKLEEIRESAKKQEYTGKERRKEDDPSYFGHFCLEGLERRRSGSIFS